MKLVKVLCSVVWNIFSIKFYICAANITICLFFRKIHIKMSDILSSQTDTVPDCASCKSNDQVIKIVYGDPMPNSNVTELAQKGLVKLGGCSPTPDGIFRKFHCKKCQIDVWLLFLSTRRLLCVFGYLLFYQCDLIFRVILF